VWRWLWWALYDGATSWATCAGWLATEVIEGEVAIVQVDWRRVVLHGAVFAPIRALLRQGTGHCMHRSPFQIKFCY
jgi:hypothetical protein